MSFDPGSTLSHYRIVSQLGAGGMGEVYRALDTKLGREVALKILPQASAGDPDRIERFKREARAVAALNHPHIVTIYSVEEAGGIHFLTMELVEGRTLESVIAGSKDPASRGLPAAQLLDVAWALSDALTAAHGRGIVHRDLKPANVMITRDGRVKVLDFGLARIQDELSAGSPDAQTMAQTGAGLVMGTVPYMSPEQVEGKPIDHRSDIFSFGAMLHEMATGQRLFQGGSPAAVVSSILRDAAPDVHALRAEMPVSFAGLVARCLDKDPNRRTQSAVEARDVLAEIRRAVSSSHSPASGSSRTLTPSAEADRLADEGARVFRIGWTGGSSARASLDQAEIYFKRALAIVPRHTKSLCEYATWHFVMSNLGFLSAEEASSKGRQFIMAALEADDQASDTHLALGKLYLYVDDDVMAAVRHIDRAVALDPTEESLRLQSIARKLQGRLDDAIDAAKGAIARQPDAPMYWNALGDAYLAAGRYPEALEALREAISRQAGFSAALERMEQALVHLGRIDEAIDFRMARLRTSGQEARVDLLLEETNNLGAEEARKRDIQRDVDLLLVEAASSDPFARGWVRTIADRIIVAYCELGDWANATVWIERSYTNRPGRLRRVLMDLPIDRKGLATNPRYVRLLRVAGLEGL